MGSTCKGKNLLLEEQILSFKKLTPTEKGGKNSIVASPVRIIGDISGMGLSCFVKKIVEID